MNVRAFGTRLDVAFRRGIALGADTTWDSHVRVWIGKSKQREHVRDFDLGRPGDLIAWLTQRLDDGDIDAAESGSGAAWMELWISMQTLFEKEIDTGFQTDPGRERITAWIGNEYYGHLAERAFNMDEFDRYEVNWWLAEESGQLINTPVEPHRTAHRESAYR